MKSGDKVTNQPTALRGDKEGSLKSTPSTTLENKANQRATQAYLGRTAQVEGKEFLRPFGSLTYNRTKAGVNYICHIRCV